MQEVVTQLRQEGRAVANALPALQLPRALVLLPDENLLLVASVKSLVQKLSEARPNEATAR